MANINNYPQFFLDPMLNLEVSANDQELVYDNVSFFSFNA